MEAEFRNSFSKDRQDSSQPVLSLSRRGLRRAYAGKAAFFSARGIRASADFSCRRTLYLLLQNSKKHTPFSNFIVPQLFSSEITFLQRCSTFLSALSFQSFLCSASLKRKSLGECCMLLQLGSRRSGIGGAWPLVRRHASRCASSSAFISPPCRKRRVKFTVSVTE